MRRLASLLAIALLLSACQSSPSSVSKSFEPASPRDGAALMYLFRPALDKVGRNDTPTLLIDEQLVAVLGYSTYTAVSLKPGIHKIRLQSGPRDSASWNTELAFDVIAGQTHYVAIWNQNQPGSTTAVVPVSSLTQAFFVPIIGAVVANVYTNSMMSRTVRLERVDQDVGKFALADLQYVQARVDELPGAQK